MFGPHRVEVGSGRLEVGRLAFCELVDMQGVLAGRQVLDIELDSYAVRRFGKGCGANALALGVFNIDREWFGCGIGGGYSGAARQDKQTHKIRDNFHRSSLYLPDQPLRSDGS
jgi:hypothetical protein